MPEHNFAREEVRAMDFEFMQEQEMLRDN